jgi:hypothetical protein
VTWPSGEYLAVKIIEFSAKGKRVATRTKKTSKAVRICPQCGVAGKVTRIIYGLPDPGLARDAELGKVVLGGCVIDDDSPVFVCTCGHQFGRTRIRAVAPPPSTDPADYATLNDWFHVVKGRVPLQMVAGIQQLMNAEKITFHAAYQRLVASENIIEVTPERTARKSTKTKARRVPPRPKAASTRKRSATQTKAVAKKKTGSRR